MAGGFLQTGAAQMLKKLALAKQDMADADRQELLSFLSGRQGSAYAPQSGEITGILKTIGEEMSKSSAEATAAEEAAIKSFNDLSSAKTKEIDALTAAIETKTERVGELGLSIVQMKNDLSDTQAALLEDKKFLADLEKGCSTKAAEEEAAAKQRAEELVALAETIKILNDDDALELFKKTLPSAGASSFVQLRTKSAAKIRASAVAAIQAVRQVSRVY